MKKRLFLILTLLVSGISYTQITDPAPYCSAIYDDVFGGIDHHISAVELNTLNNVSGAGAFAAPHYVYYNDVPTTDLERGSTHDIIISHSGGGTIHMIAAWIDFNGDDDFEDPGEKLGEEHWPAPGALTFAFTVPATAVIGVTRMRVRIYEDDDYTFSEVDPPALPCQHMIFGDPSNFGEGETEDYDINITDDDEVEELMALFTPGNTTICNDEELTFEDMSVSVTGVTDWAWTFDGGVPAMAATEGPHTVTFPTPGVYDITLEVTDITGTHDTTFVVTVEDCTVDLTALFTPENTTICVDDLLTFTDASLSEDGVTDWNWTFEGGMPADAVTEGPHDVTFGGPGTFDITLEVTDATGTHDTTFVITVLEDCDDVTAVFTPEETEICEGDCLNFTDESIGILIVEYAWTFSDPEIVGPILGEETGLVCFNNPGEQTVTLTVTNGVAVHDTTITIIVNPKPEIMIATDPGLEICEGTEVSLTATGADVYNWTDGVNNGEAFVPTETKTYTVIGENDLGCSSEEEVTIIVIECEPIVADFDFNDNICLGDCIQFTDLSTGTIANWNWDFGEGGDPMVSNEQNPIICFNTAGIFDVQLTVENDLGDAVATIKTITVNNLPTVTRSENLVIDIGSKAELLAYGSDPNGSYLWSPDEDINCIDCQFTFAEPHDSITYVVTHTDVNGCSAMDSIRVLVNFFEAVGVPSAFSPNNDGNNDILFVKGFRIDQLSFSIYNRNGEKVFETLDQNIGWDGMFRGEYENPGVFHWVLQYQLVDGNRRIQKGNVTLIK